MSGGDQSPRGQGRREVVPAVPQAMPREGSISLSYPMLNKSNYSAWCIKMEVYMKAQGVWQAVKSKEPVERREDRMALAVIFQGISEETILRLGSKKSAKDTWNTLRTMHLGATREKEDAMVNQELKKTEEEEKPDAVAVSEIQTNFQEVDDVATEVPYKNEAPVGGSISSAGTEDEVKEDVEKDTEAGKSVDIHVPEAAEEIETYDKYGVGIEKEGDVMGGVGEAGQTVDLEETRKLTEELAKGDETKIAEVSEKTEAKIRDDDQEKDDDMTVLVEDVETRGDSSIVDVEERREDHEQIGMTELTEAQEVSAMAETGDEEPEEVEEETKSAGGKRKRMKNIKTVKGTRKKKEEDRRRKRKKKKRSHSSRKRRGHRRKRRYNDSDESFDEDSKSEISVSFSGKEHTKSKSRRRKKFSGSGSKRSKGKRTKYETGSDETEMIGVTEVKTQLD